MRLSLSKHRHSVFATGLATADNRQMKSSPDQKRGVPHRRRAPARRPTARQFPSSAASDAPHTCVRAAAPPTPVRTFCVHDALRCCRQSRRNNHEALNPAHRQGWANPSIRLSWCLRIRVDLGVLSLYLRPQLKLFMRIPDMAKLNHYPSRLASRPESTSRIKTKMRIWRDNNTWGPRRPTKREGRKEGRKEGGKEREGISFPSSS